MGAAVVKDVPDGVCWQACCPNLTHSGWMMVEIERLLVGPDCSIRQAMACLDANAKGIVIVVDQRRRLLGTVTDGDIRRAILAGTNLDSTVTDLLRGQQARGGPIVSHTGASDAELLRIMNEHSVRHLPIVTEGRVVLDVAMLSEMVKQYELPLTAVVMAGGYGTRLRPLTDNLPKPMLPVGERPLLERTIEQLRHAGIRRLHLTTHYKAEVIEEYFGDGGNHGVEIRYVKEKEPLGTAGALSLIKDCDEPFLVINGDILTGIDFRALLEFHQDQKADMSVVVREYEHQVPYGVIQTSPDGLAITGVTEKPVMKYFINAGIYLINPDLCQLIPSSEPCDMPTLIGRAAAAGHRIVSFPVREYWLDVGKMEDYQRAAADLAGGALAKSTS